MRRSWLVAIAGALILAAGLGSSRIARRQRAASPPATDTNPPLAHAIDDGREAAPPEADRSPIAGLNLLRTSTDDSALFAPTDLGRARLTLDVDLQRTTAALMRLRHLPEAAVVLMDVSTGRLLVYASHVDRGQARDLCAEATAPSASLFKIVTASALVEDARLGPDTKECYSGGEQRIGASDLIPDAARDRWCTTLAGALGRSINTVFARLATEHLAPSQLEAMARRLGYGRELSFDVPVQTSAVHMPSSPLEFARTAAGFWNTTLSPLAAAEMSAIVARGGETVRPSIVESIASDSGATIWSAPDPPAPRRAIARETAEQVAAMMAHTINEGTSYRAFHDAHGTPFFPGLTIAGKTGTLTSPDTRRFYTWFTGFAPMAPQSGAKVAVAALVINGPAWQVKANVLARDVLRAYFASRGATGVTRPNTTAVARRRREK